MVSGGRPHGRRGVRRLLHDLVPAGVTTPDGIGLGSSHQDVNELYSYGERGDVRQVRASPTADYRITLEGGRVTGLTLSVVDDGCTD